jgi:hypothetical protein
MIPGVTGRLITASFAREVLPSLPGAETVPRDVASMFASWVQRVEASLGITSSVRAVTDVAVIPLINLLGLLVDSRTETAAACTLGLTAGSSGLVALVVGWSEPLDGLWRSSVVRAVARDARWCLCCNGRSLRLVDGRRSWSRDHLEFDLMSLGRDAEAQTVLWSLVRAAAMASTPPLLDRAVELSNRHGVEVCNALGLGVLRALELLLGALATGKPHPRTFSAVFEQSLTVLYRVLFLLFAEARGLVPLWHPVYRDRYSLDTIVTTLLNGHRCRGLWQAVQAISRLAHAGCSAGELRVTAFNGRLFAPGQAEAFDRTRISDAVMGDAVIAVSTTRLARHSGRVRIVYRDLDVEQLGAVYEHVLDYEPSSNARGTLTRTRDVRKASGSFYTPRSVTSFLVGRTLDPLVRGKSSDEILRLRVLDPAMGSGAFLVAACRYLSAAVEEALIAEGRWHAHDVTPAERAALRRDVASRCLFGVDLNPMAVQLARLSIWLATLAADKPLSFLDHHLVVGNSLVGATPADVQRQPSRTKGRGRRQEDLPLFRADDLSSALEHAVRVRLRLTLAPDDSAAAVREKERALSHLYRQESSIRTQSRVLDLWCAGWFWSDGRAPDRGTFRELVAQLLEGRCVLPAHVASTLLSKSDDTAARCRFHHWPLAFPEVFVDEHGQPLKSAGFDGIIGNPPWDMVRGDSGSHGVRTDRREEARHLTSFVRESGIYHVESRAHANLYQLFIERALQLVRPGGRIGLVLPAGTITDAGTASLRRHVFDRAAIDDITGLDNREAIFPIHRSTRFVLLTCTSGQPTRAIRCRFGITRADDLHVPSLPDSASIILRRPFIERLSGEDDLGIPELAGADDLALIERISASVPRLSSHEGWAARFGRELNATDDRDSFIPYAHADDGRPVVEGKQIEPFRVSLERCRLQLDRAAVDRVNLPRRPRLAYRDIASATNRLTLIAAVIPARAVTTHTLFCLKTKLPLAEQHVLCALLNSFVANYLVRLRVNIHVTVSLVSRLPVPLVRTNHPLFGRLHELSEAISDGTSAVEEMEEYAHLQALCARLYGLSTKDFAHVLSTFPLIASSTRQAAISAFNNLY